MMLINTANDKSKPEETLEEKVSGFQFKMPTSGTEGDATDTSNPKANEQKPNGIILNGQPNKPNGNGLSQTQNGQSTSNQNQFKKPSDPIPEMSNEKYEVVVGDVPEFSEEAGNKLQEQLNMLRDAIDGTGDLKDQMTNILTFLDDNPQYKENVSPQDVSVFVAACRKVAGITVTEKKTRQTKKVKTDKLTEDVLNELADLEFDL